MGFCGVDDSVDPHALLAVSARYPWAEWGVLFREDMEGKARYASRAWLEQLRAARTASVAAAAAATTTAASTNTIVAAAGAAAAAETPAPATALAPIRLAAHLCGTYCEQLLSGDTSFARALHEQHGFNRVQLNATAANAVDSSKLGAAHVAGLEAAMAELPGVEFIVQVS